MRGVVIPVGEVPLRPTINIITNLLHATKVAKLKGEILMPNYCSNTLTIECPDHIFEQIKNLVQGEHSVFDFDKIVPMPDHIFRGNLGDKERETIQVKSIFELEVCKGVSACVGRDSDVAVDSCLLGCFLHELCDSFLGQPLAPMGNKQILLW